MDTANTINEYRATIRELDQALYGLKERLREFQKYLTVDLDDARFKALQNHDDARFNLIQMTHRAQRSEFYAVESALTHAQQALDSLGDARRELFEIDRSDDSDE